MRVFILCTGRNGSTTFYHACRHITNYTVGHETNARTIGVRRLAYSDNHIEIDNRLSYHLGSLEQLYGYEPFYVHLLRDRIKVIESFNRRWELDHSIIAGFAKHIKMLPLEDLTEEDKWILSEEYVDTVNSNISSFIEGKPNRMIVRLENIQEDFKALWNAIRAIGDFEAALSEFTILHNKSHKNS